MFVTPESEGLRMRLTVKSYTETAQPTKRKETIGFSKSQLPVVYDCTVPPLMSSLAAGY